MEFVNKVELMGVVGENKLHDMGEVSVARFGLRTDYGYEGAGGSVTDSTWHNITAWEGDGIRKKDLESIRRGSVVRVVGRLRAFTYTTIDGECHKGYEVIARSLTVWND